MGSMLDRRFFRRQPLRISDTYCSLPRQNRLAQMKMNNKQLTLFLLSISDYYKLFLIFIILLLIITIYECSSSVNDSLAANDSSGTDESSGARRTVIY